MPLITDANKWRVSDNDEQYSGDDECGFPTKEEAIAGAGKALGLSPGATFWVGEARNPDPTQHVYAEDVIERIQMGEDFCTEWAEDWPSQTPDQEDELDEMLREAFRVWLTKHNLWPRFFTIENAERCVVPEVD